MGTRREASWVSIVGARPQFIKLAPIRRAIHAHNQAGGLPSIRHVIVHTGQHYDREMTGLFSELRLNCWAAQFCLGHSGFSHESRAGVGFEW